MQKTTPGYLPSAIHADHLTPRGTVSSPSLNSDKLSENKEVKRWVENYLGVGEWVMDQSVAVMGSSGFFERKR